MKFNISKPWLTLDKWQKDYIKEEKDCFLLTGRQIGKSTAMALKAAERAIKYGNRDILIIALTEKQAFQLFTKALNYLRARYSHEILGGVKKPTKHEIHLKNKSVIRCYATGLTGDGLRCFTITDLFVDEASRIDDAVFVAILPMLSVTKGRIDVASTPCGAKGYFYECSKDKNYVKFYASAEDCERTDPERRERDKERMTKKQYAQEYLAVFTDSLNRLFSDKWLKGVCVRDKGLSNGKKYLGVDVGFREDESSFEIFAKESKNKFIQIDNITTRMNMLTDTTNKILELESQQKFRAIGIDDGGIGAGVLHSLMLEKSTKRKVKGLNNSSKVEDADGNFKSLKNVMYFNLLALGEQRKVQLLNDDEVISSLKSIQTEWVVKEGLQSRLKIYGSNSHITEGIIRALILAVEDTSLELWAR